MTNTEKVVNWALAQEGKRASDFFFATEWCALFVSKALSQADYILQKSSVYSCTAQMDYWKTKGIWNDGITGISENCIVYFDWDMTGDCDHVGITYKVKDNLLYTVEGNTRGDIWSNTSVNLMTRSVFRYIRGYVKISDIFSENVKANPSPTPIYYGKNYVNRDSSGKCQVIQHMLNVVNNAGLTEDGILGDKSDTAIKSFQRKHNLEIDGIVGDETLFKLTQLYFNIPLENFKIGY